MSEEGTSFHICKDCNKEFALTADQRNRILSHTDEKTGLPFTLPKRCLSCRNAKNIRNREKEEEEARKQLNQDEWRARGMRVADQEAARVDEF